MQDLDTIETAIQVLNVTPNQINIKARFAEVNQEDTRALGFDWLLGNCRMGGDGGVVGAGGTQPQLSGAPSGSNPQGFFPGTTLGDFPPGSSDQVLSSSLRQLQGTGGGTIPALMSFTGILTDPQFKVVIRAMEQRQGVDLLYAPEVTTTSGRQAQIQTLDLRTIVTGTQQNTGQQGQTAAVGGLSVVFDAHSLMIVFGGTFGATMINYPIRDVLGVFKVVKHVFFSRIWSSQELISRFLEFSRKARRDGLLGAGTGIG